MTTEVSSTPRLGSGIDIFVDYRIKVASESVEIDSRGVFGSIGEYRSRYESPWWNGSKLCNWHAVAGDDERLAGLDFPQHDRRVVS